MVQRASVQQQTVEHGHVRGFVSRQVYDSIRSPKILRVTEHAQTVCTRPFLLPSKTMLAVYVPARVYNRKEGEYPTTLWYCVTTLSRVHDLWSDIHVLEVSQFVVCGHAS